MASPALSVAELRRWQCRHCATMGAAPDVREEGAWWEAVSRQHAEASPECQHWYGTQHIEPEPSRPAPAA